MRLFSGMKKSSEKALALGLLFVALLLLYWLVFDLYLGYLSDQKSEYHYKKDEVGRIQSILSQETEWQVLIQKNSKKAQNQQLFLRSQKASAAASELQNRLKGLIKRHSKARIQTIKDNPIVKKEGYTELSVQMRMRSITHEEIKKILYFIESAKPILRIKKLDVKRQQLSYKRLVAQKPILEMTIVVSGFFKEH